MNPAIFPEWALQTIANRTADAHDPAGAARRILAELRPVMRMVSDLGTDAGRVLLEGCIEELLPTGPTFRAEYGDTLDG